MDIKIHYDSTSEANRLLHTLVQTANGFYFQKNFAVLPDPVHTNAGTVHLPRLNYHSIKGGWQKWATIQDNIPLNYPLDWVTEVLALLPPLKPLNSTINRIEAELATEWLPSLNYLTNLFPTLNEKVTGINIRLTSYGTKMSYERINWPNPQHFTCYLRADMPSSVIYEALIQGILAQQNEYFLERNWIGKESIADFILHQLKSVHAIKQHTPTVESLLKLDPKLLSASHLYMSQLGLQLTKPLCLRNDIIYHHDRPITPQLTSIQNIILQKLIEKDGCCLSYDEIGALLWHQADNFSLWAINKSISRLKYKLKTLNINASIDNNKGQGYYLTYQSGIK